MLKIKIVGREKPLWTEKVEYEHGRIMFETHTKAGKTFRHSMQDSQVLEIIDLGALDEHDDTAPEKLLGNEE